MRRHICRICFKKFPNGRALGGHMRFHMMNPYKFPEEYKDVDHQEQISASSSSKHENEAKPTRCKCLTNQDYSTFPVETSSDLLQDSESETELSKSKRVRKSRISNKKVIKSNVENISESSISEITHDEDVAYCLMMLSRDKWIKEVEDSKNDDFGIVVTVSDPKVALDTGPDNLSRPIPSLASTSHVTKVKITCDKYRCETCNKVFKTYQALGGHKSNHKKIKVNYEHATEKKHECPICYRVFASGQALGGHKRSHLSKFAREHLNLVKPFSRKIDLNLPAPLDDDDEEINQMDFSVVYDA